jgi:hypothetical protein
MHQLMMARFGVGLAFGFMLLCDMAKELTHIVVARKVLNDLKEAGHRLLAQLLDKSLSAYYLGAIIPDAFFYEMSPLRRVSRDYAHICRALHLGETARNDQLAVSFFDSISANPQGWRQKVAFAAGIVTHTVSDRIIHDLIDHYTTSWNEKGSLAMASHRQLETLIDMLLLEQLGSHPRDFLLEGLVDLDKPTEDYLFRYYLTNLLGDSRTLHPSLLRALGRAYAQQRILLKLFALKPLYHIMNFSNKLSAGRLSVLSSLFYPQTVGTQTFPILHRLDLNALTNGRYFTGTLGTLVDAVTTEAICHIRVGLDRLA